MVPIVGKVLGSLGPKSKRVLVYKLWLYFNMLYLSNSPSHCNHINNMATLMSLPIEILFNILSYSSAFDPTPAPSHPLYNLAATSRHLRSVVEEYARVLLKQHAGFTPPKSSKIFACRNKWIKWLSIHCQFCKKKSVRKAILYPTLACCQACDKANFPKLVRAHFWWPGSTTDRNIVYELGYESAPPLKT